MTLRRLTGCVQPTGDGAARRTLLSERRYGSAGGRSVAGSVVRFTCTGERRPFELNTRVVGQWADVSNAVMHETALHASLQATVRPTYLRYVAIFAENDR